MAPLPTTAPATAPLLALRGSTRRARGAALLVVIVSIAILTTLAVDLAYSTRVSLLTAANARDELRAEYLARSAVQFSRLVLKFQRQIDDAVPPGAGGVRVQIFNLVPVDKSIADGLFGGAKQDEGPASTFTASLDDEGRKVNAQMDAIGAQAGAQIRSLLELVADPRWDPLFDREDASGLRVARTDLAVYLHDWTDDNSIGSAVSPNLDGFADAFADENQPYSRGDDPYQAKNARFDSLDELYLVAGIDDAFMAAFGSQLTVYPDRNKLMNVNTDDPDEMVRNAATIVDRSDRLRLLVPEVKALLVKRVREARSTGYLAITPSTFSQIVGDLGFRVAGNAASLFTDRSLVYRVRASGAAGATERRVDAVFSFDKSQCSGAPADFGCPLHWREE